MRILICDDEQKLIDLELSILQEYCRSTNIAATFFTFTDSLSAGNIGEFDIAFLDIDMEKLNGIELARKLRSKNPTSIIIFVTNFIQYAPEGYEVNAFRYLLKSDIPYKLIPYFVNSLQEVIDSRQTVTFSISGESIDVQTKNILYLESDKHIIVMHLINDARTEYRFYGNMAVLSDKLQNLGFLRIHKSYLVNMEYIELFQYEKVYAFARQVSRYHAYHSLDDPAFSAESYLLVPTPTPAEIIERQQHLVNINHTILALSPKQAKRCYDYFYCGISMPSIAEKEGTTVGSVSGSIKSALINLREKCNLFIKP